jgi:hypothetical protein
MIYIRDKKLYNSLSDYLKDYSIVNCRVKAFYRVLEPLLSKEPLNNYPYIDIYLEIKNARPLGRFTTKPRSFYKRYNKDPYIVLYLSTHLLLKKQVKSFTDTIYHEFIHYSQWLNNFRRGHYGILKANTNGDINKYIEALKIK